jgi:protein-tyrosine sulfotransferase
MKDRIIINQAVVLYNRLRLINPFRRNIPINSKLSNYKPFFIVGAGRSGTTLLRSMLSQSSNIVIPPESLVLPIIYKRYRVYRKAPWSEFVKLILGEFISHPLFKYWNIDITPLFNSLINIPENEQSLFKIINGVYKEYCTMQGRPEAIWGDKTPLNTFYLNELDRLFDKPLYINLIRDGRDVVASMIKNKIKKDKREACDHWKEALKITDEYHMKYPERMLNITYDNLVSKPERELRKICEFLGITYLNTMLANNKAIDKLGDSVYAHHQNLKNPINTLSVGKWKDYFDEADSKWINQYLGDDLRSRGYLD